MSQSVTADQIPHAFRKKAYLLGSIPWQCSNVDPRIPYALYIPEEAYNDPARTRKLPLLVYIHGTRRDTSALQGSLIPFADTTQCAILAPLFPVGLDHPHDLSSYKFLNAKSYRSDLVLLSIVKEVSKRWQHIKTDKFFLMGFSGGGQFAHRFLYVHPERLLGISVGAPGNVTMLDRQTAWPEGVSDVEHIFGKKLDVEAIRKVPIQLVIGDEDNVVHGGSGFWEFVSKKAPMMAEAMQDELRPMKTGRWDTIKRLREHWNDLCIDSDLQVVPGIAHSHVGVQETVTSFFQSLLSPS